MQNHVFLCLHDCINIQVRCMTVSCIYTCKNMMIYNIKKQKCSRASSILSKYYLNLKLNHRFVCLFKMKNTVFPGMTTKLKWILSISSRFFFILRSSCKIQVQLIRFYTFTVLKKYFSYISSQVECKESGEHDTGIISTFQT